MRCNEFLTRFGIADPAARERLRLRKIELYPTFFDTVRLNRPLWEFCCQFRAQGGRVWIVSTGSRENIENAMRHLGIAGPGEMQAGAEEQGQMLTGEGQAGRGQTGEGQTGGVQAGGGQVGGGQAGGAQAGEVQAGEVQAGGAQAGGAQAGEVQAGEVQAGGGQAGGVQCQATHGRLEQGENEQDGRGQTGDMQRRATLGAREKHRTAPGAVDGILTGADVAHSKPAPDCFLEAMRREGVTPSETLIFEDSEIGLEAASSSGAAYMKVTL